MNQVALSTSVGAIDELVKVTTRGSHATYMGPNGSNPNPT
jgi:hypothetical protein